MIFFVSILGKYMMATSCPGKVVSGRAIHRLVDSWKLQTLRSTITVTYHMGHTLQEMGFALRTLEISPENIRQNQRPQDGLGEQSGLSSNCVVKKELLDVPERPKVNDGEVIDLTEEQDIERSRQESAMDLSLKSGGSNNNNNAETAPHSDDGYNSDNLCIVEDEVGDTAQEPSRTESESVMDTGDKPSENRTQSDDKVKSPQFEDDKLDSPSQVEDNEHVESPQQKVNDVEMVQQGELLRNESNDNVVDPENRCLNGGDGNNEVDMAPETEIQTSNEDAEKSLETSEKALSQEQPSDKTSEESEQNVAEMEDQNGSENIESEKDLQIVKSRGLGEDSVDETDTTASDIQPVETEDDITNVGEQSENKGSTGSVNGNVEKHTEESEPSRAEDETEDKNESMTEKQNSGEPRSSEKLDVSAENEKSETVEEPPLATDGTSCQSEQGNKNLEPHPEDQVVLDVEELDEFHTDEETEHNNVEGVERSKDSST